MSSSLAGRQVSFSVVDVGTLRRFLAFGEIRSLFRRFWGGEGFGFGRAGCGWVVHLGIIFADLLSRCVEIWNQDVRGASGCLSTERCSFSPVRFRVHGEDFCSS